MFIIIDTANAIQNTVMLCFISTQTVSAARNDHAIEKITANIQKPGAVFCRKYDATNSSITTPAHISGLTCALKNGTSKALLQNKNGTTPEPQEDAASEDPVSEPSVRPTTSGTNLLVPAVIILALVGGVAFYFFRVKGAASNNSKKRGFDEEDDDFDDGDTVNEDTE